jgi:hypothetical protein
MDDIPEDKLRIFVRQFLDEIKALILAKQLYVENRLKNRDALLELGLTESDRERFILSLSVLDYISGPTQDLLKSGYYWVFGKHIESADVYIKLKIIEHLGEEYAICYSFHKAENPLNYHFAD